MTREYFGFDFEAHLRTMARPARRDTMAAVRLDDNGRIFEATPAAAAMLGYSPSQLVGHTLKTLAAEEWSAAAERLTAAFVAGTAESGELVLRGRSGRRTRIHLTSRAADAPGQRVVVWRELAEEPGAAAAHEPGSEELHRLAYELISAQESERSRVSAELHDGVAPLVIMAKFMVEDALQRLMRGAHNEAAEVLMNAIARLRDTIGEIRRISTELRPSMLDDLGLLPTIEWFCRQCERAWRSLRIERDLRAAESDVPDALKLDIFRIVQESVTNAAQHAHANSVRVSLVRRGNELELTVTDDGSGFDATSLFAGNSALIGVGLQSIRKRVDGTGGRFILEATPLRGTVIGAVWRLDRQPQAHARAA
jgi:two-component system NarL family sensor kinase